MREVQLLWICCTAGYWLINVYVWRRIGLLTCCEVRSIVVWMCVYVSEEMKMRKAREGGAEADQTDDAMHFRNSGLDGRCMRSVKVDCRAYGDVLVVFWDLFLSSLVYLVKLEGIYPSSNTSGRFDSTSMS